MIYLPVRSNEREPVGHIRTSEANISLWSSLPFVGKTNSVAPDNREAEPSARVKPGGTYDPVTRCERSVFAKDAVFCNPCYSSKTDVHI